MTAGLRSFSGVVGANHDQCGFKRMGQNVFNILSLNMILIIKRIEREHWRHRSYSRSFAEKRKEGNRAVAEGRSGANRIL